VFAVETHNLRKEFLRRDAERTRMRKRRRRVAALEGVSFAIERGECVAILGQNGSGKSTLVRVLSTLLLPDGGTAEVFGHDVLKEQRAVQRLVNRVSVEASFFKKMSSEENLAYAARFYGLPPSVTQRSIPEIHERVGFPVSRRHEGMEHLSRGMQQKVALARALLTAPVLLLLDEPTTGLDPQARHLLWDRFYRLKRDGVTMVLTTHYMEEAEQLCDRLVIMDGGRIVTEGSPRELVARHATREVVELRFTTPEARDAALPRLAEFGERVEALTDRVIVYTHDAAKVVGLVGDGELQPESVYERRGTLEDVFLILTGRTLED
jgi:lipooligosaccharide transport system ATP-binding protein